MGKKKVSTFEVSLEIVPLSGNLTKKTVTVSASATLAEVAQAAGITVDKKNFFVDDKPATSETRVTANSKIQITERPQGS